MRRVLLTATAALAVCAGAAAGKAADTSLTGLVTSSQEGAMEGVLVSARKEGSTIRITVATDAQGRYPFRPISSNPATMP